MSGPAADVIRVDVDDAALGVVRWRGQTNASLVVAIHGVAGNAWAWSATARHLAAATTMVAVDLRGRGTSHDAPRRPGVRQHADDVAAVVARLGGAPAVVCGHAYGATVALALAERHPEAVERLVLVDGGPPAPPIDGMTADGGATPSERCGELIARIDTEWVDRVSYLRQWTHHPALLGIVTPEIDRYLLSGLVERGDVFVNAVDGVAVEADARELVDDEWVRTLFERARQPAIVLRAPNGLTGAPPPEVDPDWEARAPHHDWRCITGTNRLSIVLGDAGANAIAAAIVTRRTAPV